MKIQALHYTNKVLGIRGLHLKFVISSNSLSYVTSTRSKQRSLPDSLKVLHQQINLLLCSISLQKVYIGDQDKETTSTQVYH